MTIDPAEHVGLAEFLSRKYGRSAPDPEGVREVATLALLRAASGFDSALGTWGAYAGTSVAKAVRGEVSRQIREPRSEPLTVVGRDGSEYERADLPHSTQEGEERLMGESLRSAIECLPEREARIVRLRFGLEGEPMSLEAVGEAVGLSRDRIRVLEQKAIEKLKRSLTASGMASVGRTSR